MTRAICLLLCLTLGCGPAYNGFSTDKADPTPIVKPVTAEHAFAVLADSIPTEKDPARPVKTLDQLARLLNVQKRCGWITSETADKFDQAFPNAASDGRPLTAADAAILKGLK